MNKFYISVCPNVETSRIAQNSRQPWLPEKCFFYFISLNPGRLSYFKITRKTVHVPDFDE